MTFELVSVLAVFVLLALSGGAYFLARRTGIPHTVLLVVLGVLLIPLSHLDALSFLEAFRLTPELLLYIFLPTLIFESAYNLNIRRLTADAIPVSILAILSLLVSTLAVAAALWWLLPFFGLPIPFPLAFVFGALISSTDPVAVLALFKEYGAPRRLALLFEGESLFNDGTSFALFLVALEVAAKGVFDLPTFGEGFLSFSIMLVGGALFGLALGGLFAKLIGYARSNESVSITLMLVLAHTTFLLSELIGHYARIGAFEVHLSSIIATTVAAMVIGNYGRAKLPPRAEEFIERFWGQIAFLANSIVFILIGTLAVSLPLSSPGLVVPILIVVAVVASARALSIYPVVGLWNKVAKPFETIPLAWQHLLAWGSLRGALAVTMALLIPVDWVIETAAYTGPVQDVVLAFTTGCIFVTLFVKATTIGPLMRHLGADKFNPLEQAEHDVARAHIYAQVGGHLDSFGAKGYIPEQALRDLRAAYAARFEESKAAYGQTRENGLERAAVRIWAVGREKRALHVLYHYGEVTESVYKKTLAKLTVRQEHAERGFSSSEIHLAGTGDVFEWCANQVRRLLGRETPADRIRARYMYYRAHAIIAHKAQKELRALAAMADPVFSNEAVEETLSVYDTFRTHTLGIVRELEETHPDIIGPLSQRLADRAVLKIEERLLERFKAQEMITPKVYLALYEEFERETAR